MKRVTLLILLAVALVPVAHAGPVKASQNNGTLTITARKLQPGVVYAASCELTGWNIGTSGYAANQNGKVVVPVPLPLAGAPGPYLCWLRVDLTDWSAPPALLANGRPARVSGVAT